MTDLVFRDRRLNIAFVTMSFYLLMLTFSVLPQDVKKLKADAEKGDSNAQFYLGCMYHEGKGGLTKDIVEAAKWMRKAAEQGLVQAQSILGGMYLYGEGLTQDKVEAVKWYRMAAEHGDATAQFGLGLMYHDGQGGLTKDIVEAAKWMRKAAEQGLVQAQSILGVIYFYGEGVTQDKTEAVKWYRMAAERGDAMAQYNLGLMYAKGEVVPQNYEEAYFWSSLSAANGYENAEELRNRTATVLSPSSLSAVQKKTLDWKPILKNPAPTTSEADSQLQTANSSAASAERTKFRDSFPSHIGIIVSYVDARTGNVTDNWLSKNQMKWIEEQDKKINKGNQESRLVYVRNRDAADYIVLWTEAQGFRPYVTYVPRTTTDTATFSGSYSSHGTTGSSIWGNFDGNIQIQRTYYEKVNNEWPYVDAVVIVIAAHTGQMVYQTWHQGNWRWSKPEKDCLVDAINYLISMSPH